MNHELHTYSALTFFIVWLGCIAVFTFKIYKLRRIEPTIISTTSFYAKIATIIAMIAILIYVV